THEVARRVRVAGELGGGGVDDSAGAAPLRVAVERAALGLDAAHAAIAATDGTIDLAAVHVGAGLLATGATGDVARGEALGGHVGHAAAAEVGSAALVAALVDGAVIIGRAAAVAGAVDAALAEVGREGAADGRDERTRGEREGDDEAGHR